MENYENAALGKYILRFAIINLIVTVAIAAVLIIFNLDKNFLHLIGLMASAMIVGEKFVKDNKRVPETSEKIQLIGYSFVVSLLGSLIMLGVTIIVYPELLTALSALFSTLSMGILVFALGLTFLFMLIALWLGYGFLTTMQFNTLKKKDKL